MVDHTLSGRSLSVTIINTNSPFDWILMEQLLQFVALMTIILEYETSPE